MTISDIFVLFILLGAAALPVVVAAGLLFYVGSSIIRNQNKRG